MEKVFFKKCGDESKSDIAKLLLEEVIKSKGIELKNNVPIKVHFGEAGNDTYIPADYYNGIIESLKERNVESSFIETNVLYRGSRTTRENHLKVAKEHGFTQLPIIIADGDRGENYDEIEINKNFFKSCKIGSEYQKFDQMLVCNHFKGHGMAGFGGALKQLAMGFASRGGKMAQHSNMFPTVNGEKCINCKLCIKKCDSDAIEINSEKFAVIDHDKCSGCAGCIAVCPTGAIRNDWEGTNFKEKIAEYAYAASKDKEIVYITFALNITPDCDCVGMHMDLVAKDIGIFASTDPVALDSACLDMLQKNENNDLFEAGRVALDHGELIGLGSKEYEIIEL